MTESGQFGAIQSLQVEFRWTSSDFQPVAQSEGVSKELLALIQRELGFVLRPPTHSSLTSSVVLKAVAWKALNDGELAGIILLRRRFGRSALAHGAGPDLSRSAMATRVLIVPEFEFARKAALRLCCGGLGAAAGPLIGSARAGEALPSLPGSNIDDILEDPSEPSFSAVEATSTFRDTLIALTARLISQPGGCVAAPVSGTSFDVPSLQPAVDVAEQIPLLAGLTAITGRFFAEVPDGEASWDGSFSTFEQLTGRAPKGLPQVVFEDYGSISASAYLGGHSRLFQEGDTAEGPSWEAAEILVDDYLAGGESSLAALLTEMAAGRYSSAERLGRLVKHAEIIVSGGANFVEVAVPGTALLGSASETDDRSTSDLDYAAAEDASTMSEGLAPTTQASPEWALCVQMLTELQGEMRDLRSAVDSLGALRGGSQGLRTPAASTSDHRRSLDAVRPFGGGAGLPLWGNALYWILVASVVTLGAMIWEVWR